MNRKNYINTILGEYSGKLEITGHKERDADLTNYKHTKKENF